jgi:HEAT repeat protein
MIVNGDAFRLAEMMIREKKIFPAFFDLLTHEEFSTRLGAMAAVETLAEMDRGVAAQLIDPLIKGLEDQTDPVKGDILYILGEAGDRQIIPFLKRVVAGKYAEDVKEAAEDAIDCISGR